MKCINTTLLCLLVGSPFGLFAGGARADNVTIGSPLTGPFPLFLACTETLPTCTVTQMSLPGGALTSPVAGTIVRWQMAGATVGKSFRLRVITKVPTGYTAERSSGPAISAGLGVETFPAEIPISAGDTIALDVEKGASIGFNPIPSARFLVFAPAPEEGVPTPPGLGEFSGELAFSAEIQVPPTLTRLTPESGPQAGGTEVRIEGADLQGTSEVSFGDVAAEEFTVDSASRITAIAPEAIEAGNVQVSVTTVAGSAVSADQYTYRSPEEEEAEELRREGGEAEPLPRAQNPPGCRPPNVRGRRVRRARRALRRAHCPVGKVRRKRAPKRKRGRVLRQAPPPGSPLRQGASVALTVGR